MASALQAYVNNPAGFLPESADYPLDSLARPQLFWDDQEVAQVDLFRLPQFAANLRNQIANAVREGQTWTIGRHGLPMVSYVGGDFKWLSYRLDVAAVGPYATEGHIPVVQREVTKKQGHMEQYAVGAKFNTQELRGQPNTQASQGEQQGGLIMYLVTKQLLQVALETINDKVMRTFTNVSDRVMAELRRANYFNKMSFAQRFAHEHRTHGCISNGGSVFTHLMTDIERERKNLDLPALDHIIVHPVTQALIAQSRTLFAVYGNPGAKRGEQSPDEVTVAGYHMEVADAYRKDGYGTPYNHLEHVTISAEFYPTWRPGNKVDKGNIAIYNEATDSFEIVESDTAGVWVRDMITRDVAASILFKQEPGNTLMGVWDSMTSGDGSDFTVYVTQKWSVGTYIQDDGFVQILPATTFLGYRYGKSTSKCEGAEGKTAYEAWISGGFSDAAGRKRGDMYFVKADDLPQLSKHACNYALVVAPDGATRANGDPSVETAGLLEKWNDEVAKSLRKKLNDSAEFGERAQPSVYAVRGTVYAARGDAIDMKDQWSSGTKTADGGDFVGADSVRAGIRVKPESLPVSIGH